VLGRTQGYRALPIRDESFDCPVNGPKTPSMVTAWFATPEEIERIVAGAPIHLRIIGSDHPPVMLEVGEVPG
jgi:hypothetical protein